MCRKCIKFSYGNLGNSREYKNGRRFLSSLSFSKFWEQNFMFFGSKHVETEPSCLHELTTFLKYYMPLTNYFSEQMKSTSGEAGEKERRKLEI